MVFSLGVVVCYLQQSHYTFTYCKLSGSIHAQRCISCSQRVPVIYHWINAVLCTWDQLLSQSCFLSVVLLHVVSSYRDLDVTVNQKPYFVEHNKQHRIQSSSACINVLSLIFSFMLAYIVYVSPHLYCDSYLVIHSQSHQCCKV